MVGAIAMQSRNPRWKGVPTSSARGEASTLRTMGGDQEQLDEALLEVATCWNNGIYRVRPDNQNSFVALDREQYVVSMLACALY